MVQIIVYTGAIMMLFLFVLMLVGRDASDSLIETLRGQRIAAILLGRRLRRRWSAPALYRALGDDRRRSGLAEANADGNVQGIAALLFTKYVFAFEVTSALLITAAVGAMILAHVERRQGREARPAGPDAGPLRARATTRRRSPGPGVYATSTSVATPARLPDGTPGRAQHLADPAVARADRRRGRPEGHRRKVDAPCT